MSSTDRERPVSTYPQEIQQYSSNTMSCHAQTHAKNKYFGTSHLLATSTLSIRNKCQDLLEVDRTWFEMKQEGTVISISGHDPIPWHQGPSSTPPQRRPHHMGDGTGEFLMNWKKKQTSDTNINTFGLHGCFTVHYYCLESFRIIFKEYGTLHFPLSKL